MLTLDIKYFVWKHHEKDTFLQIITCISYPLKPSHRWPFSPRKMVGLPNSHQWNMDSSTWKR